MTSVRACALRSSINCPGLIKILTKRYFTDYVLVDGHDAFITVDQLLQKAEVIRANRLESVAYIYTAVFKDRALVN